MRVGAVQAAVGGEVEGDLDEAVERFIQDRAKWAGPSGDPTRAVPGVGVVSGQHEVRSGKLVDHGGRVLKHVDVTPVYVGRYWGTKAGKADRTFNDAALAALVKDPGMTGIWKEYRAGKGTTQASVEVPDMIRTRMTQSQVESLVEQQVLSGKFDTSNPERVFTLVMPPGCELTTEGGASSRHGLGGYHGSIQVRGKEVYYAAVAYSERRPGSLNGIDFTGNPRDNISIVESHEITEAVTDPDVERAERENDVGRLGWYDDVTPWRAPGSADLMWGKGEIGDIPVLNADLSGDVSLKSVWGRAGDYAFQTEWSNRDNRAELSPG
jgi:hypothetical protein